MMIKKTIVALMMTGLLLQAFSDWLLPYTQTKDYDYSEYYDAVLAERISTKLINPKDRLAKAWEYYVQTYVMPNGLVRHLRMADDGVTVIGQNEAVSEGIGYGMLLALINNDQATFNKIFEGANAQMWKGSSYACWKWSNGGCEGSGCATDADLDVALALVFADKLQERGFWSPYNKSNVTYKSRATEMINSIKTTMTSGDLLLPGDAWPGGPTNPSYFSVAAMRIFNAYQKTHDFTGVIKKCYDILENTSNYNKGQAPDWCNSNGGSLAGDGTKGAQDYYGMSIEAVRVPWRIGLDAIWFNDTRAINYCQNTKKTLTNYGSEEVYSQMIEYKPNGSPDMDDPSRQADNFERIATWSTAVLGSKDKTYTKGVFTKDINYAITGGNDHTYFGPMESNKNFYYKQSLAMLGYATIFGLFPNVLADMENIPTIDTVHISTGLSVSATTVKLPGGKVNITAKFDKAASWKLILTGQISGKKDTLSDSSSQISVEWNGDGWFTEETIKAVLTVTNLATNTAATLLNTQFTITEIVPILKKTNFKKEKFFSIYQGKNSLIINAGNNLLPVLNVYKLNGERVISHKFNMNTRYADNHLVPVAAEKMTPGQYIAQLSDESGTSPIMVRRFIWR